MKRTVEIVLVLVLLGIIGVIPTVVSSVERECDEMPVVEILPVLTFPDVVESVLPAVVYIEANGPRGMWSGSGVCITPVGPILTAKHVIEDAEEFLVVFPDGREYTSTDTFVSERVAVDAGFIEISVDANDPVPCISEWGMSSQLRVGEGVFVVGSPFGKQLFNTVTKGIVSCVSRPVPFFSEKNILHVDAQSWPGNSGGPVFNLEGDFIGLLIGGMYGADGIGFVTPSEVCAKLMGVYLANLKLMEME